MLEHSQVLVLMGSRPERTPGERLALYRHCAPLLGESTRTFWDMRHDRIPEGIGSLGKFERYFRLFRRWVVPLIHGKRHVAELLAGGTRAARETFYQAQWDTWRWRLLFQIFFSRAAMGRLGRDPAFFRYVEGSVADRILERTRHAFVELNPADNPYLHWIFTGTHGDALPFVLRPENFESIRTNLDRLVLRHGALEDVLDELGPHSVDRFNLSDIFEYMNEEASERLLSHLALTGRQGGRLAYWNMLAPRSRPQSLADRLRPLETRAQELWMRDRAFFYSAFRLEEVL
jgi:S-adenosylmethionine-diacylglycerol 3-amino-3-carboxypropyl transferase